MTPETHKPKNTAERMTRVKASWDKAPSGPKKDSALKHYQAAEKAHKDKHDNDANKELDLATKALG